MAGRKLAEALAQAGIASLRYDKRGVGTSGRNFDPAALTLDDFVADAAAVVTHARADARFGPITVLGHSKGGLIAIELARTTPVDAQVTVADARALAAARPDARLVIVPRMNHVLCDEASIALPQSSYVDPTRPLVPAAVIAIVAGVAR